MKKIITILLVTFIILNIFSFSVFADNEVIKCEIRLSYTVKNNTGIGNDFKVIYYINDKQVYSGQSLTFDKGEKIKLSAYVAEMDTYPDESEVYGYFYLNNTTHSTSTTLYADLTEYMGRANKGATATVAVKFKFIPQSGEKNGWIKDYLLENSDFDWVKASKKHAKKRKKELEESKKIRDIYRLETASDGSNKWVIINEGEDLYYNYTNTSKNYLIPFNPLTRGKASSLLPNFKYKTVTAKCEKFGIKDLTPQKTVFYSTEKFVLSKDKRIENVVNYANKYLETVRNKYTEIKYDFEKMQFNSDKIKNQNTLYKIVVFKNNNIQFAEDIKNNKYEFENTNGVGSAAEYIKSILMLNSQADNFAK